jgi:hypothetical protein
MMVDAKTNRHQLSGDSYSAVVIPADDTISLIGVQSDIVVKLYDPTNLPYDNECVVWRSSVAEVAFSG